MKTELYLQGILRSQDLVETSSELKELREHREQVENVLRTRFAESSSPTIRYGGSYAKRTLIRECYDLDVICYFESSDVAAGDTLKDVYENVRAALSETYSVESKNSSLRLRSRETEDFATRDFHIDVVPGRFTDARKSDCYIHQAAAEKTRLKTNIEVHIAHVKDSRLLDAIRLLKLWKARRGVVLKNFVFELLIIELLQNKKMASLSEQLLFVWQQMSERKFPPAVRDPANPEGNDLSSCLADVWPLLNHAAIETLKAVEDFGWTSIFGSDGGQSADQHERIEILRMVAAAVSTPSKPWCPFE